jgi:hypothetical protein
MIDSSKSPRMFDGSLIASVLGVASELGQLRNLVQVLSPVAACPSAMKLSSRVPGPVLSMQQWLGESILSAALRHVVACLAASKAYRNSKQLQMLPIE